jgi:hypothetical protein
MSTYHPVQEAAEGAATKRKGEAMRFIVKGSAINGLPTPPELVLAAYEASFEIFASKKDPRIVAAMPHADERATTLIVEASTGEELSDVLSSLPGFWFSSWESHPIQDADNVLKLLRTTLTQLRSQN